MAQPLSQIGVQSSLSCTTGAAVSLTLPSNTTPNHVMISVQSNDVRVRFDGTAPVTGAPATGTGILFVAGSTISLMDPNFDYRAMIVNMKLIGATATATLDVAFFN